MNFLKDAGINFASKTLDDCIYYLVNEISQKDRNFHIAQIVNTIRHFSIEMDEGRESFSSVNEHFTRLKNDRIKERGLTSHRDTDFSKFYIVICFFMFCANTKNKSSQIGANKILTMCENSVDIGIKDAVLEVTTPFRIIFNEGRAAPVQRQSELKKALPLPTSALPIDRNALPKMIGVERVVSLARQVGEWSIGEGGKIEHAIAKEAKDLTDASEKKLGSDNYNQELISHFVALAMNKYGIDPLALQPKEHSDIIIWLRNLWEGVVVTLRKLHTDPSTLTADEVVSMAYAATRVDRLTDCPVNAEGLQTLQAGDVSENLIEKLENLTSPINSPPAEPSPHVLYIGDEFNLIRVHKFPSMAAPWSTKGDGESWEWGDFLLTVQEKPKTVAEVIAETIGDKAVAKLLGGAPPITAMTYYYAVTVFYKPSKNLSGHLDWPVLSVGLEQMDLKKLAILMDGVEIPDEMPIVIGLFSSSIRAQLNNYEGLLNLDACRSVLFKKIQDRLKLSGDPNKIGSIAAARTILIPPLVEEDECEQSTIVPVSRTTQESPTHWWPILGFMAFVVILIILISPLKPNSFSSSIPIIKSVETPTDAPKPTQTQVATVSAGEQDAVQNEQTNNDTSQAVVETRLRIEQEVERANLATKMRNDLANLKKAEIEERQKRQEAEKRESNGVLALPTALTQSLPSDGYIQSENFIWEPIQATATWDNAQSICLHSTKLGYKWRQPTAKELLSLYQKESNVLRIRGWTLGDTWSSNEGVFWGSNHNVVNLALGSGGVSSDSKGHYVSCVADRR